MTRAPLPSPRSPLTIAVAALLAPLAQGDAKLTESAKALQTYAQTGVASRAALIAFCSPALRALASPRALSTASASSFV